MTKAVYRNMKSGKYYTFDKLDNGDTVFYAVFSKKVDEAPYKIDCKGKAYKVLDLVEYTTKNGIKCMKDA